MSRVRRIGGNVAAASIGVIVGGLVMLAIDGATRDVPTSPVVVAPTPAPIPTSESAPHEPRRKVLLAWSPGGMPRGSERIVEAIRGVTRATTIGAGLDWIEGSRTTDGTPLDRPPPGYAIPFEVAAIEPREYARFVAPSERATIQALRPDGAVLAQSSAELRGAGEGLHLRMQGRSVTVRATVSDVTTQGYEALIAAPAPASWKRVDSFLLIHVDGTRARRAVQSRLQRLLGDGRQLRVRAEGETPFLRYGDAVLPQLMIKRAFGEFAARPLPTGKISVEERWRRQNVAAGRVPILGEITCHRAVFPQLRRALREIAGSGLAFTVDPGDYGGCFSPRFIDSNPGGRLSHHSWGIAIDINVGTNRPGTKPDIDPRVVAAFEDAGLTWGGRWLVPDGMHFEWVRFP